MDFESPTETNVPSDAPPTLYYVLQAFAAALGLLTVVAALIGLADLSRQGGSLGVTLLAVAALLVLGLATVGLLIGLAAVVRGVAAFAAAQTRVERTVARLASGVAPAASSAPPSAPAPPSSGDSAALESIHRVLEEVRDNILLTDEERRTKHQRLVAIERRERTLQIQQAVEGGHFQRARQLLLEFERRIGGDEDTKQLLEFIEAAAQRAEAEDVAAAARQCEELMSLTSWDRAIQIAEELIDRHPNALPARQLLARVQREKQVHQQEHRNRLFLTFQRHTANREWRAALQVARQLVEAYPDSIEAESIRAQKETLETNAEIEHRKQLEAQYKAQLDEHRYAEALALARDVIRLYPESPQAKVLREQIPYLEKRMQAGFGRRSP